MKCVFCNKNIDKKPVENHFKCPHCGTVQETILIDRPYIYSVGNHSHLEASHVPVR